MFVALYTALWFWKDVIKQLHNNSTALGRNFILLNLQSPSSEGETVVQFMTTGLFSILKFHTQQNSFFQQFFNLISLKFLATKLENFDKWKVFQAAFHFSTIWTVELADYKLLQSQVVVNECSAFLAFFSDLLEAFLVVIFDFNHFNVWPNRTFVHKFRTTEIGIKAKMFHLFEDRHCSAVVQPTCNTVIKSEMLDICKLRFHLAQCRISYLDCFKCFISLRIYPLICQLKPFNIMKACRKSSEIIRIRSLYVKFKRCDVLVAVDHAQNIAGERIVFAFNENSTSSPAALIRFLQLTRMLSVSGKSAYHDISKYFHLNWGINGVSELRYAVFRCKSFTFSTLLRKLTRFPRLIGLLLRWAQSWESLLIVNSPAVFNSRRSTNMSLWCR